MHHLSAIIGDSESHVIPVNIPARLSFLDRSRADHNGPKAFLYQVTVLYALLRLDVIEGNDSWKSDQLLAPQLEFSA